MGWALRSMDKIWLLMEKGLFIWSLSRGDSIEILCCKLSGIRYLAMVTSTLDNFRKESSAVMVYWFLLSRWNGCLVNFLRVSWAVFRILTTSNSVSLSSGFGLKTWGWCTEGFMSVGLTRTLFFLMRFTFTIYWKRPFQDKWLISILIRFRCRIRTNKSCPGFRVNLKRDHLVVWSILKWRKSWTITTDRRLPRVPSK